jgi:hypothetical protein
VGTPRRNAVHPARRGAALKRVTGYRVTMTAAKHGGPTPRRERFDSPREVRAALLPEAVAVFEAAYQRALREASETLSLETLQPTLVN